jgi:hypothetical protein
MHRKEAAEQRISATRSVSAAAVLIVVVAFAALITRWATDDSAPVADAGPSTQPAGAPVLPSRDRAPDVAPMVTAPAAFPSDDRGFINSSARCRGGAPAKAIRRTEGSLVVICGEGTGRYEYLGVRLSDAAVLRTNAQTDSTRSFLARKSGVLYAVSPTESKVTSGGTVIKQEPMIEYREVPR